MRRNAHRATFDVRIQRKSQGKHVFLRKTVWCKVSEAEKGKKDIQVKWDILLWAIRIQKVKEGVYGKGQPSLSCWSTSRLNRVYAKSGWPRVESQSLSKLSKMYEWKGCRMWGFEA